MGPKIFITGGTGYIGGSVLDTLASRRPEYTIRALLRTVPENFSTLYPDVEVVKGTFDSHEVLRKAASEADIVVHAGNSDHVAAVKSLLDGLVMKSPSGSPKFFIHLSGTGLIADFLDPTYLGRLNPQVWSDISDVDAITSLPDQALHRPVDKMIQEAARKHEAILKTAIVCPPDIHGRGTGPGKQVSIYTPLYIEAIRAHGNTPFYVNEGENARGWAHIKDVMQIYLQLVESAVAGGQGADWGAQSYYFATTEACTQHEIASRTAQILHGHGLIEKPDTKSLPLEVIDTMALMPGYQFLGRYLFASNARTTPDRARKVFGWTGGDEPSFWETLEEEVLAAWKK